MVIHHIFGVKRQLLLVHNAYFLNDFLFVPYAVLSHFFWVKSGGMQSLIPIAENPKCLARTNACNYLANIRQKSCRPFHERSSPRQSIVSCHSGNSRGENFA